MGDAVDDATMPAVVITGMQRSGLSRAAAVVAAAGVQIGSPPASFGPDQSFPVVADPAFTRLHEQILVANGLSRAGYSCQVPATIPAAMCAAATDLLARRRAGGRIWGWADPRTTLFLDFWAERLPEARFVFVLRPPWDVVDSLFRQGAEVFAVNPRLAVDLWVATNRRILAFVRRHPERCAVIEARRLGAEPAAFVARLAGLLDRPLALPGPAAPPWLPTTSDTPEHRGLVAAIAAEAFPLFAALRDHAGDQDDAAASTHIVPDAASAGLAEWEHGVATARAIRMHEVAAVESRLVAERDRGIAAARAETAAVAARLASERAAFAAERRDLETRLRFAAAAARMAREESRSARRRSLAARIGAECGRLARRVGGAISRAA